MIVHVVIGPTAGGKTTYAHAMVENDQSAVLINADASVFYRDLVIGSGSPVQERPYKLSHMLDLDQRYSPFKFVEDLVPILLENRDKTVVIVGGSMWYIKFLTCDFTASGSNTATHAQRYIRNNSKDFVVHAILKERRDLKYAISSRCHFMLTTGWLEEVSSLMQKYDMTFLRSIKSIGYSDCISYLLGHISYSDLLTSIIKKTCYLAKRQMTWLRHWSRINRVYYSS